MKAVAVASQVIDKLLGRTDFTPPTTLYVALYTTAPTKFGGGVEVSAANGYARKSVPNTVTDWPAAVEGVKSNATLIQFAAPTGPWGTVVAFGLHTALTGDHLYIAGVLDAPIAIDVGSDPKFVPGDLSVVET